MKDIKLDQLSKENIDIAKKMCDRYVGVGLYTEDILLDIIEKENHIFELIKNKNDDVIGYFYCLYINDITDEELEKLSLIQISNRIKKYKTIGICKSIGIVENYRKKNIAQCLLNHYTDLLKEQGCEIILVPAWKKEKYIPAKSHLEKCGYTLFSELKRPWYDNTDLQCPFCKMQNCICDAVVFRNGKK